MALKPINLKSEPLAVISTLTLNRIQEPLIAHIADLVDFADGRIQRSDVESGLQAFFLAVYEMQEDCPDCKGTGGFLPDDPRCLWKCGRCGGKGWTWKTEERS